MLAFNGGSRVRGAVSSQARSAVLVVVDGEVVAADSDAVRLVGARATADVVGRDVSDFVAPGWTEVDPTITVRAELMTVVRLDGGFQVVEWFSAPARWDGRAATRLSFRPLEAEPLRIREIAIGIGTATADAVVVADTRFGIRSFSPAAEQLYGISESEALNRCLTEIISLGADGIEAVLPHLRRNGHWHGRAVQHHAAADARLTATVVQDAGGRDTGTIWVVRPHDATDDPGREALDRLTASDPLALEVARALSRDEFTVRYEPIVALETDRVVGLEAGLQWRHPDRGLLTTATIPASVADCGPVTRLLLDSAARSGDGLPVAINLSAAQLHEPGLPGWLASAGGLWLEISETVLATEMQRLGARLRDFEALGASIAVDDFGAGYSCLASLRRLPIRRLKAAWARLSPPVMALTGELGIEVVATGIDTAAAREHVRRLGCRLCQGPFLTSGAGSPA